MESAHPPLPTRLPVRRYRGDLRTYLQRCAVDYSRYLQAVFNHATTAEQIAIANVVRRLLTEIRRQREDRHKVRYVCLACACERHRAQQARRDRRPKLFPTRIA
jgi:hypothetical protein